MRKKIENPIFPLLVILLVISIGSSGYIYFLERELSGIRSQALKMKEDYEGRIKELEKNLSNSISDNIFLSETLNAEQSKNSFFEKQIKEIAGTVGTLDKLSKTDQELLQKYSKVYFLNENYVPDYLSEINPKYVYNEEKAQKIHTQVLPFLEGLTQATEAERVTLKILSAYRSFDTQAAVKSGYRVTYGSGANKFSADQGYSEHQLGTAIDFTTPETGEEFLKFEKTPAYQWLLDNAYKYGFILSYPKDNNYYQFEPWHWRFVGVALANKLHLEQKYFYDLSQREIDQSLISIFDQPGS